MTPPILNTADQTSPTPVKVVLVGSGAHARVIHGAAASLPGECDSKGIVVIDGIDAFAQRCMQEIDKELVALLEETNAYCFEDFDIFHRRRGWYNPRIIRLPPVQRTRIISHRIRSKPVVLCRYKWKLKKQKKVSKR